jgi:hypothetical protein
MQPITLGPPPPCRLDAMHFPIALIQTPTVVLSDPGIDLDATQRPEGKGVISVVGVERR